MNTALNQTSDFDNAIIEEDDFNEAYKLIKYVHSSFSYNQPSGAFIVGESGTGKTAVLESYLKDNPSSYNNERDHVPVVYINAASTPSIHAFAKILIKALDPTGAMPKSILDKQLRIEVLKRELGLELVIVDEFHDMLTTARSPMNTGVVNFVKYLLSQLNVAVIVAGLPHSEEILSADRQIATRCCNTKHMKPFTAINADEGCRFQMYVNGLLEVYPHQFEDMPTDEFLYRLLLATTGNKRSIKRLFQYAASETPIGKVTTKRVLDEGWNLVIDVDSRVCINTAPFKATLNKVKKALVKGGLLHE